MSKYYFYLTDEERSLIIESLILKKNALISEGTYTDGIDDTLLKILRSKKNCAFAFVNFTLMFILSEQTVFTPMTKNGTR